MATVWIPAQLRDLTHGQETAAVAGSRVGQVIDALEEAFPGIKARLCDSDRVRPGIAVIVDGEVARLGLLQPVGPASEVHFLPAIGGGESRRP
jgi:molybdopterin synthase sulfur carrier subunit